MTQRQYELGDAELEILKVLWDHGSATVRDVLTRLHGMGRRVAYTTVQTLLTRLEQKGHVVSDKSDFAFVYRSKLTRNRVTQSRLKTLVKQLYDGAAGPLVLQLVRTEQFTPEEIEELHGLLDRLESGTKQAKK